MGMIRRKSGSKSKTQAVIRRARRSDQEPVGRLWYDLLRSQGELDTRFAPSDDALVRWRNDYPAWLDRLSRRIYVAEVDGTVCGFVTAEQWAPPPIFQDQPGVYINELYVEPDRRRSGVGSKLVQAVREWAEEIGVHQLRAGVLIRNDESAAFWRSIGAEAVTQTFSLRVDVEAEEVKRERSLGFRQ